MNSNLQTAHGGLKTIACLSDGVVAQQRDTSQELDVLEPTNRYNGNVTEHLGWLASDEQAKVDAQ